MHTMTRMDEPGPTEPSAVELWPFVRSAPQRQTNAGVHRRQMPAWVLDRFAGPVDNLNWTGGAGADSGCRGGCGMTCWRGLRD
jgi:hypothetical protein